MSNNRWWEQYKVDLPVGVSGAWRVERFDVSKKDEQWSSFMDGRRHVNEGTYTRLMRGGEVIMSDTRAEIVDHLTVIRKACGHVLINGLGLGAVLCAVARKPEVEHVTVVELESDVIALAAQHYIDRYGAKIEIICADAFTWQPPKGKRFDVVWHDIWPYITTDNLKEMGKLHRRYGRRCNWQGSWAKELCQFHRRREKRQYSGWF